MYMHTKRLSQGYPSLQVPGDLLYPPEPVLAPQLQQDPPGRLGKPLQDLVPPPPGVVEVRIKRWLVAGPLCVCVCVCLYMYCMKELEMCIKKRIFIKQLQCFSQCCREFPMHTRSCVCVCVTVCACVCLFVCSFFPQKADVESTELVMQ